ncbi:MAG: 50S ribosomal protein L21 [Verrucomicrobia bacterium]|jgi:large subunit ribosomal protein L21|nr:50S ribosomal protein L21 [Verrucomicrobiota bacterium]
MAYAIIKVGGKQFRVSEGDLVDVEKLDAQKGDTVTFENVLLISKDGATTVGAPEVKGASVTAEVIEQRRLPKVTAFKFKRRKGFHKTKGHRQPVTRVSIKGI